MSPQGWKNSRAPNTVVIGDTTHQLVEGFFKCDALGAAELRGISQPVNIYQVSGEIPAQSRLGIASMSGLTPLIGREREALRYSNKTGRTHSQRRGKHSLLKVKLASENQDVSN